MGEPSGAPGRPDLDRIRGQLRELGYLRGPLSPFSGWLLAGRGGPSSFLAINLAASLRVGLVGGPLLGVTAAIAVAIANRPHFGSARELALLILYFATALGLILAVLEFLTDLALAWAARRGLVLVGRLEQISARVGFLFMAATTLYLASLLRQGRSITAGGVRAWAFWSVALVICLGVGHIIGRLTRLGSLLAFAAGGGLSPTAGPRSAGRFLGFGALLFLAAALALVFVPAGWFESDHRILVTTHPTPGRIVLIGIDGLSADRFEWSKDSGIAPHLMRLEREGARYDVTREEPAVPPAVWTSIATGRPPTEHGILGYQAERVPGLTSTVQRNPDATMSISPGLLIPGHRAKSLPVSSGHRRALAVWEILAREGVQTLAVNWWATWPALPGAGIVISERALPRFSSGQPPDRDVTPESLQQALGSRFAQDIAQTGEPSLSGADSGPAIDAYHGLVARRLFQAGLARAVFLYLPGLDITRSRHPDSEMGPIAASLGRADMLVGEFLTILEPEDLLLVVGDPGRVADREPAGTARGILLVFGGRVRSGRSDRVVTSRDLAPTLLALAGFPAARDMSGSPILDFLEPGDAARLSGEPIESYGSRPAPEGGPEADPFDPELLDRLRSLGYIQ